MPTKKEWLKALEESIELWIQRQRIPIDSKDCPLCLLSEKYIVYYEDSCEGCPVHLSTHKKHCVNTVYDHTSIAQIRSELTYDYSKTQKYDKKMLEELIDIREKYINLIKEN